jgi:glutamine cyclotransferase
LVVPTKKKTQNYLIILLIGLIIISVGYVKLTYRPKEYQRYTYKIVNKYPHDPDAFTQGLVYHDGILYEGTGIRGQSSIRIVDLESGEIHRIHNLSKDHFGEGITILNGQIIQLTWQSKIGFVYNKEDLDVLKTFEITNEGWGLTNDGSNLILSDGTSTLYFLDPVSFQVVRSVEIYDDDDAVTEINELEYIDGVVYANIWKTDLIALIEPLKGSVIGWIDLSDLKSHIDDDLKIDVLNGIAYDEESKHLLVTGKYWPILFEIELISIG